jgi:hypothetical protein
MNAESDHHTGKRLVFKVSIGAAAIAVGYFVAERTLVFGAVALLVVIVAGVLIWYWSRR